MAELTTLESKLGEVIGLAMAAQDATKQVLRLLGEEDAPALEQTVQRMHAEAADTERRATGVAAGFEGKKTAILEKAREVKAEAKEMRDAYLGNDADALDGFEFLTMAEAGEVGHWAIVGLLARKAGSAEVQTLAEWVKPIQQRHFEETLAGSLELARAEDPAATPA